MSIMTGGISSADSVGPEQTKSDTARTKLAEDLNHFLILLTTQLKHQDPMDPMDATEFTSQLVQFATVEQEIYANSNLEKLIDLQATTQMASVVSYIGMAAESVGTDLPLTDGSAEFSYVLAETARAVVVNIADENGRLVFTTEGEKGLGKHAIEWDGVDSDGNQLPDGNYTVTVLPTDHGGAPMEVVQTVIGVISGVSQDNGRTTLYMGSIEVDLEDVISVREGKTPAEPVVN